MYLYVMCMTTIEGSTVKEAVFDECVPTGRTLHSTLRRLKLIIRTAFFCALAA